MNWLLLRRRTAQGLLLCLALSMWLTSAYAQTSLADQLQGLQGLSGDSPQTILQQLGGQGNTGGTGSSAGSTGGVNGTINGTGTRQDTADSLKRRIAEEDLLIKRNALAPTDTVVVELALPGTMAKAIVRTTGTLDPSAETAPRRIRAVPTVPLKPDVQKRLEDIVAVVNAGNPYQLDREGRLNLPDFAPIQLAGLNEVQSVQLLSLEPEFQQLDVSLSRLPVTKPGPAGLKPFGYNLFEDESSRFAPPSDASVPDNYFVGPGDELVVQLYGSQNRNLKLPVNREGVVNFPELGPIRVEGQTFSAVKASIEARVPREMIGVRADVTVGNLRPIDITVMGEVRQPGNQTVKGLATITSVLFSSGGVTAIGSLRDIQLRRPGAAVRHLDLYDLLIRGDGSDDVRLQSGDRIFVPTVGQTVSVEGEVRRPAIYELRGEDAAAVLQMAGGLTPEADPVRSSMTRVDDQYRRVVLDLDFTQASSRSQPMRNGDAVSVARLRPQLDSGVVLEGFVHRPGPVAWRQGQRLTDVIGSIDELKPNADSHYLLIRRETGPDRKIEIFSADLVAALTQRGGVADIALAPRDRIIVFDLATGRKRIIEPLLDDLRLQSGLARPTEVVRVEGRVKVPGEYPLEPGMTVSDLLRAGGSLDAAAYGGKAQLARYDVDGSGVRQTDLIDIDLAAVLRGDATADIALRSFDHLLIKEIPGWADQEYVTLKGEVLFPGTYPIRRGQTMYELLQQAGGLTPRAFAKGSVFTRVGSREREQKAIDDLAERMKGEISALSLQAAAANQAGAAQALASLEPILKQVKGTPAAGRLIIDLDGLMAGGKGSPKDILLHDGDVLIVRPQTQEVTVIGEVQTTTSHLYNSNLSRNDYISLSGGTTRRADKGKIYVVRADGSVIAQNGSFLRRSHDVAIQPGDTIVVPFDTERMPRLPFWQAVTSIIYNLAISVAAINSF